ncbi:unnamed protein product [Ambrosiozyma monospora]|uniref:Unnamed protein product n=1 Tax=Ambrosiozyma monospora TaxID=43982 RepID=A0ACB5TBS1_AMBMO|nr:unnamed protein product [Ambrosiozyma monospora]
MRKFSTDTAELVPVIERLIESTFEQTTTVLYGDEVELPPDLQVPALEQSSTLKLRLETLEDVCLSGLLTRSKKLKILEVYIDMSHNEADMLNELAKEIRNWLNLDPRNKTDKSLILNLKKS